MAHWFLSFVKANGFAGACFVVAEQPHEAIAESHRRGCNPGGEVMIIRVDYGDPRCTVRPRPEQFNRLYDRAELEKLFGATRKVSDRDPRAN